MSNAFTVTLPDGTPYELYKPHATQILFHQNSTPNLIAIGNRGGGKSQVLRFDAHMRALSVPGASLILVRKTYPDLLKSHIIFIKEEMRFLGGHYHATDHIAYYPNGSRLFLSHVASEADALNLLSAEFLAAYFDELSVIPWEYFVKLCASVRVKSGLGLTAVVRAATNPLGPSAEDIRKYFVDHDVDPEEDPEYNPLDWAAIRIDRQDNPHIDQEQYIKRFAGMPAHIRRAWLDGEFALENALFDFIPTKAGKPYHVIRDIDLKAILKVATVYRTIDAGWFPDPTIVLWVAHLGNRHIVFNEKIWYRTTAIDIAQQIKEEDERLGVQRVCVSYCDPTMDINTTADIKTIKEIYEAHGIPMECSINNREMFATVMHNALAEESGENTPRIQFYVNGKDGCPYTVRTIPQMRYDPKRPRAMADHKQDHGVIACCYYLMSHSSDLHQEASTAITMRPWMKEKKGSRFVLGSDEVRNPSLLNR